MKKLGDVCQQDWRKIARHIERRCEENIPVCSDRQKEIAREIERTRPGKTDPAVHSPPVGLNRYLNICWCFLRVVFGWTAEDRPVLRQTIDRGIDRPRIVVLVRHVD